MRLAYNHAEIAPRPLKPALLELDGISRRTVEEHHRRYEGYVASRNELLARLAAVDLAAADETYSELRALKLALAFAVGGIKSHELYFEHLGGGGGDPKGRFAALVERDFGSVEAWRADLGATALASRGGWAWTAYDWDERRLFNYLGDAQDAVPVWNASPLVALDVGEHAYVADFGADRAGYVEAFFANLDYGVVNAWVEAYDIRP